jgi:hypothetical protein
VNGNVAAGDASTIGGGFGNTVAVTGTYATVGGGLQNTANGAGATVGGGVGNTASSTYATVGGGWLNTASDLRATVGGGELNVASGLGATVGGGGSNSASGPDATVGGGGSNDASGTGATVGGGELNVASGLGATVGGGGSNDASGTGATVGGGYNNTASGYRATVGGGGNNIASQDYATVSGGADNTASDLYATVPGGYNNTATGDYSFAAGRNARALHDGAFVWSSNEGTLISSTDTNQFLVRATGGISLTTNVGGTTGCNLDAGGGTWDCTSDRNAKANFAPVDGVAILNTLAGLPIETWNFNTQDASIRHMGPMAQDWHAAFGLGGSDTTISAVDADGVALAAIQGLYAVVQEKETRITALEAQVAALQSSGAPAGIPAALPWLLLAGLGLLNLGGLAGYALARRPRP